jgi:type IV secretory pathway TrbD component
MQSIAQRRQIPIHDALVQPMLMIGAERDLVVFMTILLAMLVFACATWICTVVALICWVAAIVVLQRLARVDSQFSRVYLRHLKYRSRYSATSHAAALNPTALGQR